MTVLCWELRHMVQSNERLISQNPWMNFQKTTWVCVTHPNFRISNNAPNSSCNSSESNRGILFRSRSVINGKGAVQTIIGRRRNRGESVGCYQGWPSEWGTRTTLNRSTSDWPLELWVCSRPEVRVPDGSQRSLSSPRTSQPEAKNISPSLLLAGVFTLNISVDSTLNVELVQLICQDVLVQTSCQLCIQSQTNSMKPVVHWDHTICYRTIFSWYWRKS